MLPPPPRIDSDHGPFVGQGIRLGRAKPVSTLVKDYRANHAAGVSGVTLIPDAPRQGSPLRLRARTRHYAVAVRANMRSILVAVMKSFSCSPLIFLVCKEIVAMPQPKLIFG